MTSVKALDFIALSINLRSVIGRCCSLLKDSSEGMVGRDTRKQPVHPRVWGNGPYTDDWDVISTTVYAGHMRWSEVSEARRRGRVARVVVQVVPAAERYVGSIGTVPEPGPGGDPEDERRGGFQCRMGNRHEGVGDSGCRPREPVGLEGKLEVEVKHRVSAEWRPK